MIYRYSMLNSVYYCPKKYELEYILNLRPEIGSLDLEFGTAIHESIAAHFGGKDAVSHFDFLWSLVDPEVPATGRYKASELASIGVEMLRKWVKYHAEKYEPLHVEKRIAFKIGDYNLEGTPDFIGNYNGILSVVDWKTSAYSYDKRKALVDEQVWVYVEAVRQVYGLDIKQVVYAPLVKDGAKVQNPVVCDVTPERLKEKLANVTAVLDDISTRKVFTKNTQNCLRCSFFSTCYKEGEVK